jgi:hypothetical protein
MKKMIFFFFNTLILTSSCFAYNIYCTSLNDFTWRSAYDANVDTGYFNCQYKITAKFTFKEESLHANLKLIKTGGSEKNFCDSELNYTLQGTCKAAVDSYPIKLYGNKTNFRGFWPQQNYIAFDGIIPIGPIFGNLSVNLIPD